MMRGALLVALVAAAMVGSEASEGVWTTAAKFPTKISDHSCAIGGSTIYVLGGCSNDIYFEDNYSQCDSFSNRTYKYDIPSDTWTRLADMPRTRYRMAAAIVGNATFGYEIFIFGGITGTDQEDPLRVIDVYTTTTNTWRTLAVQLDDPVSDLASFVVGTDILLVGGYTITEGGQVYTASNRTHVFDTLTGQFRYNVAELNVARGDICATTDGVTAVSFGGYSEEDFCHPLGTTERLFTNPYRWEVASPDPFHNTSDDRGDSGCAIRDSDLYIFGGEYKVTYNEDSCQSNPSIDVESYSIADDTWSSHNNKMQLAVPNFRMCVVNYDNKFYMIGGSGPLETIDDRNAHRLFDATYVFGPKQNGASSSYAASFVVALFAAISALFVSA